jgi:hypothetical protein
VTPGVVRGKFVFERFGHVIVPGLADQFGDPGVVQGPRQGIQGNQGSSGSQRGSGFIPRRRQVEVERPDLKASKLEFGHSEHPHPGPHGPGLLQEGSVKAGKLGHRPLSVFEVQLEGRAMRGAKVGVQDDSGHRVGRPPADGLAEGDLVPAVDVVSGKVFQQLGDRADAQLG